MCPSSWKLYVDDFPFFWFLSSSSRTHVRALWSFGVGELMPMARLSFMEKTILNFHFDYLTTRLRSVMAQYGPERPIFGQKSQFLAKVGRFKPKILNFLGGDWRFLSAGNMTSPKMCTILPVGTITISLFVSQLEPFERRSPFFLKIFTWPHALWDSVCAR